MNVNELIRKSFRAKHSETEKPFPKIFSGSLSGSVCASYVRCSKGGCKCARGALHGPYFHRYRWRGGRVVKQYIRLKDVEAVRAACMRNRKRRNHVTEGKRHYKALFERLRLASTGENANG